MKQFSTVSTRRNCEKQTFGQLLQCDFERYNKCMKNYWIVSISVLLTVKMLIIWIKTILVLSLHCFSLLLQLPPLKRKGAFTLDRKQISSFDFNHWKVFAVCLIPQKPVNVTSNTHFTQVDRFSISPQNPRPFMSLHYFPVLIKWLNKLKSELSWHLTLSYFVIVSNHAVIQNSFNGFIVFWGGVLTEACVPFSQRSHYIQPRCRCNARQYWPIHPYNCKHLKKLYIFWIYIWLLLNHDA